MLLDEGLIKYNLPPPHFFQATLCKLLCVRWGRHQHCELPAFKADRKRPPVM